MTDILFIVIAAVVGIAAGYIVRKTVGESKIKSAEAEAARIVEEATKNTDAIRKEAMLEAKDEAYKIRSEAEAEVKERRAEQQRSEKRLIQKEEALDRKTEALEQKELNMQKTEAQIEKIKADVESLYAKQAEELERMANLTAEEAREQLLNKVEEEIKHETAVMIKEMEAEAKETADKKAREIISLAIQRCAADHVAETTVSVVALPSDDMKGRIIGREGRNIRTIETLTGVELIIDDTPEVITISGFDPVRREVARIALEKLIADGRIHPARIEEMVEKAQNEVDNTIKQAGEKAVFETGVHGLHPEEIRLLGRLKYRTSFGQNALRHSIEVALLSGNMADEMGADSTQAKRAGLLHDIGKALTQEAGGSHIQLGVEVAKKYKENKDIVHAIEAHHNDVDPRTTVAFIVQAADAISAARPGARREDVENYIKRLQKLEEIANEFKGVDKTFAIQAGREIRVMVKPEMINDDQMKILARDIANKIEGDLDYPGQIKVNVIRESRTVDYAK